MYRSIGLGFGIILDKIGKLLGRPRSNLSDDDYKIALRAQILINRSNGTPEDLIKVAILSMPVGYSIVYTETYPAALVIDIPQQVLFTVLVLFKNLVLTKDGGVRLQLVYSDQDPGHVFTLAPGSVITTSASKGFSDIDRGSGYAGGQLRNVLDSQGFHT